MEEKRISNTDILIYALTIFFTFFLFIISNKLSAPIIIEINSGASIIDLMFKSEDNISIFINLVSPLMLLICGVVILVTTLRNMVKSILFQEDSVINKSILVILSFILFIVLTKAIVIGWSLFFMILLCILVGFVLFAMLATFLNSTSN